MKKFAQINYLSRRFHSNFMVAYDTDTIEPQVGDYVVVTSQSNIFALAKVIDVFEQNDLQVKELELTSETGKNYDLWKRELEDENGCVIEETYRYYGEEIVTLIPRNICSRFNREDESSTENSTLENELERLNSEKISLLASLTNQDIISSLLDRSNPTQAAQDIRTRIREIDVRRHEILELLN